MGAAGRPHCVELRYLAYCIPESFLHAGLVLCAPFLAHLVAPVLIVVAAGCAGGASLASTNLQFALSPESGKTAYFGVTAAMSSIATCTSAAVGTAIQPMLEKSMGDSSISLLFFVAGIGGFANLIINGRKLPSVT